MLFHIIINFYSYQPIIIQQKLFIPNLRKITSSTSSACFYNSMTYSNNSIDFSKCFISLYKFAKFYFKTTELGWVGPNNTS